MKIQTIKTNGQEYEIHRLDKALNLKEVIAYTAKLKNRTMLTLDEARAIRDNAESNRVFKEALKEGEWAYVRDSKRESEGWSACLLHLRFDRRLCVYDPGPDFVSRVVVLKILGKAEKHRHVFKCECGKVKR